MARILLVDDEKSIRFTLSEFLKQDGHDVVAAESVEQARQILADGNFDVLVTDIIMPGISGITLMQTIRTISPDVQVILITGEPTVETVTEALRAGAFDYLAKPIGRDAIQHVVKKAAQLKALNDEKVRLERENFKYQNHLEQLVDERTAALEQKQKDLLDSQNRYLAVLRGTPHVLCLLDPDWIIHYANHAAHSLLRDQAGSDESLTGEPISKYFCCADEFERFQTKFAAAPVPQIATPDEFRMQRADGYKFWGQVSVVSYEPQPGVTGYVLTLVDISDRVNAVEALRQSEERYALAARGANDGLWDWDLDHDRIYFSHRWHDMLGYTEDEYCGEPKSWHQLIHPSDLAMLEAAIQAHLAGETDQLNIEFRLIHKNGSHRWILMRGLAIRNQHGKPIRLAGSQTDITENKLAEEQLTQLALYDPLTGLSNRTLFLDRLNQRLARGRRNAEFHFAIIFIDMDRFKKINDSLGHPIGDKLLKELGARLTRTLRPGDTIARLGGDEFAILLDEIASSNHAVAVCNRLLAQLNLPFHIDTNTLHMTASFGITMGQKNYHTAQDMIRDADTAMYHAKEQGRNRYAVFDQSMHTRVVRALKLEHDIRRAITEHQLEAFYQPIVSLESGHVIGLEALVRWRHPQTGLVPPQEFIPLAEDTGLITAIDEWVLAQACADTMKWQASLAHQPDLMISINFSALNFSKKHVLDKIAAILKQTQLEPYRLHIEITESVLMERWSTIGEILDGIQKIGAKLCLDDFGTGYSSLSYLHDFPIDWLKIDRTFTMKMMEDPRSMDIVRTIITLAASLKMKVVAEGVENKQQLDQLRLLGCDYAQGYLFSKPQPEADTLNLLQQNMVW